MVAVIRNSRAIFMYLPVALAVLLYSCDHMADDVAPRRPNVNIERTQIFALSKSNAYIDLRSMISTNGEVTVSIGSQPTKGTLKELSAGFLAYKPDKNIQKGNDEFVVSVFNARNELLEKDTIHIIIEDDTTNLPCGIFPQDDSVFHVAGSEIVDVLANDLWCGDSTDLAIEIYRPNSSFPPFGGVAVVQNNRIVYTPGNAFTGVDEVIYKVSKKSDPTQFGFARLRILPVPACDWLLVRDDNFTFGADSLGHGDTLHLPVLQNDSFCDGLHYDMGFVKTPSRATAEWKDRDHIDYIIDTGLEPGFAFTDTLIYEVCEASECRQGVVIMDLTK